MNRTRGVMHRVRGWECRDISIGKGNGIFMDDKWGAGEGRSSEEGEENG